MKSLNFIFFFLMLLAVSQQQVFAQAPKLVMGRVLDKEASEKKRKPIPFDISSIGDIKIYYFNTVQEGKDMETALNQDNISLTLSAMYEIPDATGAYQITLPETGSLVIKVSTAPAVFEPINGRREITTYVDMGHVLTEIPIIGILREVISKPKKPKQYGDVMFLTAAEVPVPDRIGKNNARMIVQPYVINNTKGQTIEMYRKPRVYDGEQYYLTQDRRMGYDIKRDSLEKYIIREEPLLNEISSYTWSDTVKLSNAIDNFQILAQMQMEDYTGPYYGRILELSTRSPRRPLQFLEYSLEQYELDPKKYEEKPKVERRTGVEDISLSFLLGKAELDPNDPNNEIQLDKLKEKLLEVVNGESSSLKELHLTSVSSPEGSYASNIALSRRRLEYARSLVYSVIPAHTMKRLYTYTPNDSRVGTWLEVADLLEKDTLPAESAAIREIVEKYPNSQDMQFRHVSALPYYTTIIKKYLPKLRSMKCEYTAEIYRALTKEEILKRYQNDPEYRSGKKKFALYEYWHLFNMVKDSKELERLYRQAYDYSKELTNGKPWILAANNLAVAYLKRDTVDTEILKPLVDFSVKRCNVERTFDGRVIRIDNVEEVVANQLAMYLKKGDFSEASRLAQLLPDTEKNKKIKAFTLCLGGYYEVTSDMTDEEIAECLRTFDLVRNSSPLNNVVMCLAMDTHRWNEEAEKAMNALPADDAKTFYLKAILYCRKGDFFAMQAEDALKECFKRDSSYISKAEWDGDISEECFKYAKKGYEEDMEIEKEEGLKDK